MEEGRRNLPAINRIQHQQSGSQNGEQETFAALHPMGILAVFWKIFWKFRPFFGHWKLEPQKETGE